MAKRIFHLSTGGRSGNKEYDPTQRLKKATGSHFILRVNPRNGAQQKQNALVKLHDFWMSNAWVIGFNSCPAVMQERVPLYST